MQNDIFSTPWGHHVRIIDKLSDLIFFSTAFCVMIVCKVFWLYIGLLSCAVDGTSFLRPAQREFSAWPERYFFVPAAQIPSFSNTLQRYENFRCKTIVSPNYFS